MVTAEELHLVVAEAPDCRRAGGKRTCDHLRGCVPSLADRPFREVMTHGQTSIGWMLNATPEEIRDGRSRKRPTAAFLLADGSVENIVGVIRTRDLLEALMDGRPLNLRELARSAPVIPDLMDAMDALAVLRSADVPLALVHDEYGHFDGIVTPGSILAALDRAFAHDVGR